MIQLVKGSLGNVPDPLPAIARFLDMTFRNVNKQLVTSLILSGNGFVYIMEISDSSTEEEYSQEEYSQEVEEAADESELVRQMGEQVAKQLIQSYSLGMLCKKSELIGRQRSIWPAVKIRAQHLIKQAFGYTVMEVTSDKDVMVFVVDTEPLNSGTDHLEDDVKFQKIALFLVLGYLMLKGPPVAEGQLLEFLRKMGIEGGDPSFGNVHELLTVKLPAQMYLKRTKEVDQASDSGEVT